MKIVYEYSHLGGSEILQVRYPEWNAEINDVIGSVRAERNKISREKTKFGKALYSPIEMNAQFKNAFNTRGYSELKDVYTITVPNNDVSIPGVFK